jgi:hypothetical protein
VHTATHDPIKSALDEIEKLLPIEADALKRLDRDRIDDIVGQKLALFETLRSALGTGQVAVSHRAQLERVKKSALHNQVLLVHARDCTRSVIALATGERGNSLRPATPDASGVRLDLRG